MRPLRPYISIMFTGLLLVPIMGVQAQEENYPDPGAFVIDWERQVVITHSLGAPNTSLPQPAWRSSALRAARSAAIRDLLEAVMGVTVSSTTTVENSMLTSDIIKTHVSGVVRDYRVLKTTYFESMDVGVVVEMPLTGALYDAVLPGEMGGRIASTPLPGAAPPSARPTGAVSGVVVDATGLDATPAMAPKILDEDGEEVYGTTKVMRQYAMQQGVVGYHNNVARASEDERVAGNPLVVRALRTTGPNGCDLIISNQDARQIRQAAGNLPFLDECRVMIVLGAE
ncbi:hypothetical protein ACFL6R_03745 [Gemmatimonadota bacterium]